MATITISFNAPDHLLTYLLVHGAENFKVEGKKASKPAKPLSKPAVVPASVDSAAPYGRKKDGTPKKKMGRPARVLQ